MKKLTDVVHEDKGGKYLNYCTFNQQNKVIGLSYQCPLKKKCDNECKFYNKLYIYGK